MDSTRSLAAVVLVVFSLFSAYVLVEHGVVGLLELILANSATTLAFVDLTIALTLAMIWMWRDAHQRGITVIPYLALTCGLGSVGPLLYLVVNGTRRAA